MGSHGIGSIKVDQGYHRDRLGLVTKPSCSELLQRLPECLPRKIPAEPLAEAHRRRLGFLSVFSKSAATEMQCMFYHTHNNNNGEFLSLLPVCLEESSIDAATVAAAEEACFRQLARELLCSDVRPCHFSAVATAMPELINPVPRGTPALVEILSGPGAFLLLNEMRNAAMADDGHTA